MKCTRCGLDMERAASGSSEGVFCSSCTDAELARVMTLRRPSVMDRLRAERFSRTGRTTSAKETARTTAREKRECPRCGRPWLRDDTRCSLCGTAR